MRSMFAIALVFTACTSHADSAPPSLVGNWLFANQETRTGLGLSFGDGASYAATLLALTSSDTANAEIERGTATIDNGTITFHPAQWSCSGPDPAYSARYSFNGPSLVIERADGIFQLNPNPETGAGVPFTIAIGCFQNGAFVAHPIGAIGN